MEPLGYSGDQNSIIAGCPGAQGSSGAQRGHLLLHYMAFFVYVPTCKDFMGFAKEQMRQIINWMEFPSNFWKRKIGRKNWTRFLVYIFRTIAIVDLSVLGTPKRISTSKADGYMQCCDYRHQIAYKAFSVVSKLMA